MSRTNKETTTSEALWKLRQQLELGKPQRNPKPVWLSIKEIRRHEAIFQHRLPNEFASKAHVRELADKAAASPQKTLDPITVWWDGRGWACIDGHHRLAAYGGGTFDANNAVAVEVFEGTLEEAIAKAARGNTRSKLMMDGREKDHAAWRLVTTTELSRGKCADSSGVSESQISRMRRVKATLTGKGMGDLMNLRWHEAKLAAVGKVMEGDPWDDEAKEKMAQKWAVAIAKALGQRGSNSPDVLAKALEIYNRQLPAMLSEIWNQSPDEIDED